MDNDRRSYDHVRALVSSIHGSFAATAATQQLEDPLDLTNNNSPLLATTPSSLERQEQQQQHDDEQSSRPVSPTDAREERVAADGAAATPRGITEPGGPAETTVTSSPVAVAAASAATATVSSRSSTPTRLLHHRLRIPSLVVTSSLSPYHPGNLLAGVASTADSDHPQHRRFSFAIMRRHSNTVSTPLMWCNATTNPRALAITKPFRLPYFFYLFVQLSKQPTTTRSRLDHHPGILT
uniref:Uncharacterized protein n=1 Tax=Anopheles marajoara TaxID=58244 RepID=A0A2M4BYD8_9DIPT